MAYGVLVSLRNMPHLSLGIRGKRPVHLI